MLSLKVDVGKSFFFDRKVVADAVDSASRKNLSKFGAFVRQRARSILRYRKGSSAPGQPPSVHRTGRKERKQKDGTSKVQPISPLKEFIFFALDRSNRSVVIGPARLNKPGDAPHALEYGGTSAVQKDGKSVTINVLARPYMRPAFEHVKRELPAIWRDSVKR